jgi:cytochrome c oxidase subunit 1
MSFFTAASMIITIPTGTQIFCWLAQLWRGFEIRPPLLWVLGFFVIFIIGGLSGVTLASVPLDLQVTDTYYVVAHLHYVLIGGAVFPLIGAIYFWYPKATGRMLDERLGTWNFWAMFVGFNVTFFPMHALGLMGMPRRVYTYSATSGWSTLNFISTMGALLLATGGLLLVFNVLRSLRTGKIAGDNPWQADTLEWSLSSPPPVYDFLELPVVEGRHALWDRSEAAPFVTGMRTDIREVLITDVMDAEPIHKMDVPEPSIWPFITAVTTATMLFWATFTPWGALWGSIPIAVAVIGWFWPKYNELVFLKDSLSPGSPAPIVPEVKA